MYDSVIFIHILYFAYTVGLGLRAGNPPENLVLHRAPKCLRRASIITQEVTYLLHGAESFLRS